MEKNNFERGGELESDVAERSKKIDQELDSQLENRGATKLKGTLSRWLKVAALGLGVTLGGEACSKEGVVDAVSATKSKTAELSSGAWKATSETTGAVWSKLWEDSDELRKKVKDVEKFDTLKKEMEDKKEEIAKLESSLRDTEKRVKNLEEDIKDISKAEVKGDDGEDINSKVAMRDAELATKNAELKIQTEIKSDLAGEVEKASQELADMATKISEMFETPSEPKSTEEADTETSSSRSTDGRSYSV